MSDETWALFREVKDKSGLSWNIFINQISKQYGKKGGIKKEAR